ncbi:MAG: class I SAM-dependent methyltransferase [Lachnospiraceae bacterium]|jgi:hypothetical protein|nr:class I SAM-dependent methyltransferase [Lachnospiraceae bacterium]
MGEENKQRQEVEVFGVNYERYALGNVNRKLAKQLSVKTVAELPAMGQKACPSLYSLGFGMAGCDVTLINGDEKYKKEWDKLGIGDRVRFDHFDDIAHTGYADNSFDYVWNDVYIPMDKDPEALIDEMKRISRRYVAIFSVNAGNVGFPIHSTLHKIEKIPWTHGDKHYDRRKFVAKKMEEHGLKIVKRGFVDTPVWPDSLGFRDMRLHKNNIRFDNVDWVTPYTDMIANDSVLPWMKRMYGIWECMPMVPGIKTLYSHLFYIIGEK